MRRPNRQMIRYESYNQPIYPMMGNFQNGYGPPGYQQAPQVYQQQAPLMAVGGFYPYSAMPQSQYAPEQGMTIGQNYYNQSAPPRPNQSFSPFANPLQMKKNQQQSPPIPYPNPYPKQSFMQKPQTSGFQSVLKQFKTQDGSFDINKMMNTAGQMVGTVSQVQSMFKGLGGLFKVTP